MENEELLQLAKAFENTTVSKRDTVSKFGTDNQKRHFNKYGKFTNKKVEQALLRTLNQLFTEVDDKVKIGRGFGYKLGSAKNEVSDREDNRVSNRGSELNYTKYLDAIVLLALDSKMFSEHETTISKWVLNFGLANDLIYSIKSNPDSISSTILKNQLPTSRKPEIKVYTEDFKDKERILKNTLERMNKSNLIDFYAVPKASIITGVKYMSEDGEPVFSTATVTLKSKTVNMLNEKRRKILERLGITEYNVLKGRSANKETQRKIDQFNKEIQDFYKHGVYQKEDDGKERHLWIQFHWFNYAISVKATKTRIKNYLKKNREEFYSEYIEDSNLFLTNSQENYRTERLREIIRKAKKEKEKILCNLENERMAKESSGFNTIDTDIRSKISYWENDYIENVEKLGEYFEPDFDIRPRHEK